jgi:hypothetical protein
MMLNSKNLKSFSLLVLLGAGTAEKWKVQAFNKSKKK